MGSITVKAYAKVNLTLEIVGKKDEYHLLDSLVASIDLFDRITLKKRKDSLSSVVMQGMNSETIPLEKNNALKTAEAFSKTFNVNGVDILIDKNIPIGAGLGGSSADISGVISGMAKLYQIKDDMALKNLADRLGSDAGYMLKGGYMRMQGRGDVLTPTKIKIPLYMLLILPPNGVSAGACYTAYDKIPQTKIAKRNTEFCIRALEKGDIKEAGRYLTNDLYFPACAFCKEIEQAYREAQSFSPIAVQMTGSGSGVLALFQNKELCEWAKSRYKGNFKTIVIKTVIPQEQNKWKNPFVLKQDE